MRIIAKTGGIVIAAVVVVAIVVAACAIAWHDPWAERGSGLPQTFSLDLQKLLRVDSDLIRFRQVAEFPVPMRQVRAIAAGPQQRIYVAGDRAVQLLDADGKPQLVLPLSGEPTCLAVSGLGHVAPGRLYVGVGPRLELFDPQGNSVGTWGGLDARAVLASIAVGTDQVFVADAGTRVVLRFDASGKLLGKIGAAQTDRDIPQFIVPSPYFDIALSGDGLLHVVNPGLRRIETYSPSGELEAYWGQTGPAIERFFGCCNPSHFALLSDGRYVTAEKGIPRVKVYDDTGEFQSVVAGPAQLGIAASDLGDPRVEQGHIVFDVAVDTEGRILVLDPKRQAVRVFAATQSDGESGGEGAG